MKSPEAWHQSHQHTTYNTTKQVLVECARQNQPYTQLCARLLRREQGKCETTSQLRRMGPCALVFSTSAVRPADSGIELHNFVKWE
ncbi:uncharacterized protein LACBIDRAFT_305097 [Laccaria bicolor S238N-H82]|uniref:Predicted protein n=1 Tax=Laccaria bicolor (strain S238N-H82 / ATCC MYA-4686) TaxID=486041 RepID=B0CTE7_LACBS|nr:uncharacterized protein LACBIDRAFT_305097 [Laccaria bicolor S238N-H82]EDR14481.1 predicted protein [Laccaria bicolor S238N-H82]|eukprot:XP_001875040.1 predicted protein [Laccaria bicolor S238N-H82]